MALASVGGARDTLTTLQGPGQPPDRALRVSNAGERKLWAGTGPELLLSESFPRVTTGTTCSYCSSGVPGGDIQGTGSPAPGKRKQSCCQERSPRHE